MEYAVQFCAESLPTLEAMCLSSARLTARNAATRIWSNKDSANRYAPEAFIGLELSLVPEVESVFVELVERRLLRVITVTNKRDPTIRDRVYAREQAIIDAFPHIDFNFRVVSRMNRNLSEIIEGVGKPKYQK